MLKRDPKGRFIVWRKSVGFFRTCVVYSFCTGGRVHESISPIPMPVNPTYWGYKVYSSGVDESTYYNILRKQEDIPVTVMELPGEQKRWWMFKGKFYVEDEGYTAKEVEDLIIAQSIKRERRIERAKTIVAKEGVIEEGGRAHISDDVKMFVWKRDKGKCVKCGSRENLEFDHIIPLSRGGSNTARNIQLLCEKCNREKGDSLI